MMRMILPNRTITKMSMGIPLDDGQVPWLVSLQALISTCLKENQPGVLACSALVESYQHILLAGNRGVLVVYFKGNHDLGTDGCPIRISYESQNTEEPVCCAGGASLWAGS